MEWGIISASVHSHSGEIFIIFRKDYESCLIFFAKIQDFSADLMSIIFIQMFQMPSPDASRSSAQDPMELLSGMLSDDQKNLFRQFSETVQQQNISAQPEITAGGERRGPTSDAVAR